MFVSVYSNDYKSLIFKVSSSVIITLRPEIRNVPAKYLLYNFSSSICIIKINNHDKKPQKGLFTVL